MDGITVFMCPYMLLANLRILSYWMTVCACRCVHCVWIYTSMYRMSVSPHSLMTLQHYSITLYNIIYFCAPLYSGVLFHVYWYLYSWLLLSSICQNLICEFLSWLLDCYCGWWQVWKNVLMCIFPVLFLVYCFPIFSKQYYLSLYHHTPRQQPNLLGFLLT